MFYFVYTYKYCAHPIHVEIVLFWEDRSLPVKVYHPMIHPVLPPTKNPLQVRLSLRQFKT